ncbi:MAG: flagellar basal body rod C-terminal domain-containing protein, partial [Caulobacteraceae bacterium]
GVGLYGAFSLDADGRMTFAANSLGAQISIASDATERGSGGPSISQLFGLDAASAARRTTSFSIRGDISANPSRLALAQVDTTAALGATALLGGDNRGALALAAAGQRSTGFNAVGGLGALQTTLSQYGAQLSGLLGQRSSAAANRADNSSSVASEAASRRSAVEGVNLDEELIQLTTYQQSYNASARLIQAVKDMYDVLLQMA